MNKRSKYIGIILSLIMLISYLLPININTVYADETDSYYLVIVGIEQSQISIQKDDVFSLKIKYGVTDSRVQITSARISGSGIEYINAPEMSWSDHETYISISGLKYNGGSKTISIDLGYELKEKDGKIITTGTVSREMELVGKSSEELKDAIVIEGSKKIRVKAGKSQNAEFKIKNVSPTKINRVKIKLSLSEDVSGIEIKNKDYIEITGVDSKEVRGVQFTVGVEEGVKAGIYKMNAEIAGKNYPMELIVDSNIMPPALEVSLDTNRIFKPGTIESIMVKIHNVGDISAKNIRFEISNSPEIAVANGSSVRFIEEIKSGASQSIPVSIKIASNTGQNMVPVKIDLKYLDDEGSEKTESQYIYLSTTSGQDSSEVVISNVVGPSGIYSVDQNFTVKFNVSSKTGAENLKVSIKGDEGIVPKSQNLFVIDKLNPGESKQFAVTMAATSAASTNTHPIEIAVEYGRGDGKNTINQYTSVNISNPDEKDEEGNTIKRGVPKVIVGTYSVNPVVVKAGQEFDLEIGFLNTSKTKGVHNFKANLTVKDVGENDTGSVFTPVGASNTFYISDLNPQQTEVKKIRLYTIPSANPKTYQITIEMQYEDDKGTEITATETIGIPVEQVTKLEIGDIVYESGAMVGMAVNINTSIYNTGKTDITNIKIHMEGEGFTVQDGKAFIGILEKGAEEGYSATLIPEIPGALEGKIIIEYEDATGQINTYIKEIQLEVTEAMPEMPEDMGIEPPVEEEKKSIVLPLVIVSVLVIIAVAVVIIIRKKKKAKKEKMMFDEDI